MSTDPKIEDLHHQLFEEGLKVRRAVLGHEYVDHALQSVSSYSRPGQELITEWAWGNIWRRPGLDRRQRSLLILRNPFWSAYWATSADQCLGHEVDLGTTIAQKAWLELALHTRGAINNGLSEVEIREAVLQATVYCGTPAGVEAMQITEKTITEMVEKGEYKRLKA